MINSRLGIYIIGKNTQIEWIARNKPAVVVTLLNGIDPGWVREAKASSPQTCWLGRLYTPEQNMERHAAFVDELLRTAEPYRGALDALCGYNEIACDTAEAMARYGEIEIYRMQKLDAAGWRAGIGNWAEGNPPLPEDDPHVWRAAYPMLAEGKRLGALHVFHEYSAPAMQTDFWYHCGRFVKVYDALPEELRLEVVIGECGVDLGAVTSLNPHKRLGGWKGLWTAQQYMEQLALYDTFLDIYAARYRIRGAAVYASGDNGDRQWIPFNIDGETMERLGEHLRENPPAYGEENKMGDLVELLVKEFGGEFDDPRLALPTNPAAGEYKKRALEQIEYLVIHHTVTPADISSKAIAQYHCDADPARQKDAWPGIGYHFLIYGTPGGYHKVRYVGDLDTSRYHVGEINPRCVGIALVGDFSRATPDDKTLALTKRLCGVLDSYLGRKVKRVGHQDLQPDTECPGATWAQWKDKIIEATPAPVDDHAEIWQQLGELQGEIAELKQWRDRIRAA